MLKRFIAYYKPHKFMFALDMLAALTISLIGMVYPMVTNKMLNDLIPNRMYEQIIIAGLLVLCLYIIRMLLNYFVQYYGHVIGVKMQKQMRSDLFAHLEKLPYSFFDNHETGAILTRLTSDLFEVSELAHHGPENLFICAVMIVGSFIYLCTIDVYLTLIIFACVPFLVLALCWLLDGLLRRDRENGFRWVVGLTGGSAILYAAFYPVLIGLTIPTWYSTLLRWLPSWPF